MEGRPPGAVVYTPLCNARGGVEADVTVTKLADNSWYMCTGGGTASHDRRDCHLRRPAADLLS